MGVRLNQEPELKNPVMLCGWAGIGNVGLVAVNTMRRLVGAEEFGEIQPYDFFEPSRVVIRDGQIEEMRFPATKFYSHRGNERDIIFLVGEQQPADTQKAYEMAGMVLDTAEKFGCHRVYTSGASVTMIHHTAKPRVWVVPNDRELISEVRRYGNTVLMSEVGDTNGEGSITGLNGLLLGVAKCRRIEAVCLMGEVPYYLQGAPWPYPKASISVLEVLGRILRISLDLRELQETAGRVEANIEQILEALATAEELPEQVRAEMERLRHPPHTRLGPITETEKKEILDHIDELFKGEERP
jgi:proteasome assembly chaperone (PAC2) family protein